VFLVILFTSALLFSFSTMASGQEKEIEKIKTFIKKSRVNAAYVMGSINYLNVNRLNSFLESKGLPTVGGYYSSFGLGGHVIHNKLVAGLELVHTLEKKGPKTMDFKTSASAKYGVLNFGYLLHYKKGLMLYPYVGVGVGKLTLRITENNIDSFEDITGYQKGSEAKTTNFLINTGIALDFFYKYNERKKGQNNLVVGFRAGCIFSPYRRHWRVNHTQVPDGPDSGIYGPYIRIVIGLGGWVKKFIEKAF
jgi:opacity protein-like surface antigen